MLTISAIGHLGSDARVEANNGKPFVSFNISHNEKYTDANGVTHDNVQWISCALNGDGGKLLQYLKKGRQVYVSGRGSTRIYSSPKLRQMVAGLNISVDRIELVGGSTDDVPRQLADESGELHNVYKAYYLEAGEVKAMQIKKGESKPLYSASGQMYLISDSGWVAPTGVEVQEEQK